MPPSTDARYEHDRLSRLTCAAGPWVSASTTYSYDPVGNRTAMVRDAASMTYGYDRADRIQVAGTTSYTLNTRGNLTARGSETFAYDQANRLTSATVGGQTSTYAYSGDGLRVAQTVGGAMTRYAWESVRRRPSGIGPEYAQN